MSNLKKRKIRGVNTYAFVDTNIFLDFYRGANEASLTLLEKLATVASKIICTHQVEMEFLKNRQTALLASLKDIKPFSGQIPAVFNDATTANQVEAAKMQTEGVVKELNDKLIKIIEDPDGHDRVYEVLIKIAAQKNSLILKEGSSASKEIIDRARERFDRGCPPRKSSDSSYGDAINWEWLLECAAKHEGNFFLVTRDADYGKSSGGKNYINDYLKLEFQRRSKGKNLFLTPKLSDALKALEVKISEEEVEAEADIANKDFIENNLSEYYQKGLNEEIRRVMEGVKLPSATMGLNEEIRRVMESVKLPSATMGLSEEIRRVMESVKLPSATMGLSDEIRHVMEGVKLPSATKV